MPYFLAEGDLQTCCGPRLHVLLCAVGTVWGDLGILTRTRIVWPAMAAEARPRSYLVVESRLLVKQLAHRPLDARALLAGCYPSNFLFTSRKLHFRTNLFVHTLLSASRLIPSQYTEDTQNDKIGQSRIHRVGG